MLDFHSKGVKLGRRVLALATTLALVYLFAACSRPGTPPSSILLVSLDTVRADYLGVYGDPRGTSPHFDRLARRSSLFMRCQAQATATLPSHRSLFRSRTASQSREETPMLAELMQQAGFATVAYTGGGTIAAVHGFDAGFDLYEEHAGGLAWGNPLLAAWLDEAPREKFLAFVHTFDAHAPYDPPRAYVERFDPGYTGPVTGPETRRICRVIRGLEKPGPEGVPQLNDADRLHLAALYRGSILRTDDLFGDLLRMFEERGLFERTAIVVFSDHGEEFWDHGSLLHWHTVYQELVHVPFLIHAPGMDASLVPGTTRLMDITPTILELAGLPAHETHDGVSLVAALRGDAAARTRELASVTEMGDTKSLFEFPWKLVLDGEGAAPRLYDLVHDPAEMSDVAAGQDSLVAAMAERLLPLVTTEKVTVLSKDPVTPEQHERLKALGYVN